MRSGLHVHFQLQSPSGIFARTNADAKPWPPIVGSDEFPEKLLDIVAGECAAIEETRITTTDTVCLVKQERSVGLVPASRYLLRTVRDRIFSSRRRKTT
jgi:hypothetical protein